MSSPAQRHHTHHSVHQLSQRREEEERRSARTDGQHHQVLLILSIAASGPRVASTKVNSSVRLPICSHNIPTHLASPSARLSLPGYLPLPLSSSPALSLCLSLFSSSSLSVIHSSCLSFFHFASQASHPKHKEARSVCFPFIYRHVSSPVHVRGLWKGSDGDGVQCHHLLTPQTSPAATLQYPRGSLLRQRTKSRVAAWTMCVCARVCVRENIHTLFPGYPFIYER